MQEQPQRPPQQQKKQKKKKHGNRKLQRYRRKLRNQGIDSHTIAKLISSWVDTSPSKTHQTAQQNRQVMKSTTLENLSQSPESIQQTNTKKKKGKIDEKQTMVTKKKSHLNKAVPMEKVEARKMIKDSVDYVTMPDEIFSQMLSTAFNGSEKLICFWNEDEKIEFTRHYTSLIDRLSYVQLQEFQWKYYHHLGTRDRTSTST